jgi:ectoine hydroxylase-related dioxygenase (phytanoyl-CoA dioxygenase family)
MKVDGSVATAVKFGDLLQRDDITNRPVVDLPNLPSPTEDLAKIRSDLDQFGYALLANALSPAEVAAARGRLFEQADAEREAGIGLFDGGASLPNQRVVNLMNKGTEFVELLNHPIIDVIVKEVLGDYFLLGSYTANIAGPGSESQTLHTDQMWMIPPNDSHAMGINLAFFLDDVTEENGGTRLLPGSHKGTLRPEHPLVVTEETVAAAGPAGTILLFESRTFHGTGANVSKNSLRPVILMFFVRYFIRPQENAFFSIDPELEATLSDRLKTMLGYRVTYTVGGVDGAATEGSMAKRPDKLTGIMKPKKKREAAGR